MLAWRLTLVSCQFELHVSPICQICMGSFGNNCLLVAAPSMERIKLLLESCIFSALIHVHGWVFYLERHLLVVQLTCALLLVYGRRITS